MYYAIYICRLVYNLFRVDSLLKVSGIPMLEKKYAGNPEFEAYKAGTSAFFPWFSARR